jgi:type IV secretory pathway TrbL component
MIEATVFDDITTAFVTGLQAGTATLGVFSIPLLGVLGLIAFYWELGPRLVLGSAGMGDAIAGTLLQLLKVGVGYWVLFNLVPMSDAAFTTFLGWGASLTGSTFTGAQLGHPSIMMQMGALAIAPQQSFIDRLIGWGKVFDFDHVVNFDVAGWIIWFAVLAITLHTMMMLIEWHMSVLTATVLLPWGILNRTAFFAEASVGWLGGNLIRLLVTGAFMGIAVPLFDGIRQSNLNAATGDPSVYGQFRLVGVALVFAILAWVIPGRAANLAGRGLALSGAQIMGAAAGTTRFVLFGSSVLRGVSSMLGRV